MLKILVGLLIGAGIGAFIGWKGRCATGVCPLTSNPIAGGLYGALLGSIFASLWTAGPSEPTSRVASNAPVSGVEASAVVANSPIRIVESVEAFEALMSESSLPVLVDFWATWCPPCKTQGKVLDEMADEISDRLVLAKVDVDKVPALSSQYGIRNLPTLILFENVKKKNTLIGLQRKEELLRKLDLRERSGVRGRGGDTGAIAPDRRLCPRPRVHRRTNRPCRFRPVSGVPSAMPIYEFHCNACHLDYETRVERMGDTAPCPACGATQVERLMSAPSVHVEASSRANLPCGSNACGLSPGSTPPCCGSGMCGSE